MGRSLTLVSFQRKRRKNKRPSAAKALGPMVVPGGGSGDFTMFLRRFYSISVQNWSLVKTGFWSKPVFGQNLFLVKTGQKLLAENPVLQYFGASVLQYFGASVLRCFGASVLSTDSGPPTWSDQLSSKGLGRKSSASVLRCFSASVLQCFGASVLLY